jgi:hypothetical protein
VTRGECGANYSVTAHFECRRLFFEEVPEPVLAHLLPAERHAEDKDLFCVCFVPVKDSDKARENDFAQLPREMQIRVTDNFRRASATLRIHRKTSDRAEDPPAQIRTADQAQLFGGRAGPKDAGHERRFLLRDACGRELLRSIRPTCSCV